MPRQVGGGSEFALTPALNACNLSLLPSVRTFFPSFLRKQESRFSQMFWASVPAPDRDPGFAGVTTRADGFLLKSQVLRINPSPTCDRAVPEMPG